MFESRLLFPVQDQGKEKPGVAGRDGAEMVRIWTGRGSGALGEADHGNAVSTGQGPWGSKGPSQVRAGVKLING